ncbi:MAG TPA: HAD-IA family hydrolase [Burkholderiales bacterium]|nr:HAD-IA family hydrolase [Burkholderiales bacterium]
MAELKAVIFDVDGTLADTERDGHRLAFNAAFREFGLDWHWDAAQYGDLILVAGGKERLRHWITHHAPECALGRDVERWVGELHAAKTRLFRELLARRAIPPRLGVARLLAELRGAGVRLGIATTMSEEGLLALLRALFGDEAPGWFDAIGAGDVVLSKKPAPDVYLWVLGRLGLRAADCLAIEDSEHGLKAAQGAGIPAVVTVSPYSKGSEFADAVAVVSDLGEPGQPMTLIRGDAGGAEYVDLGLLRRWHGAPAHRIQDEGGSDA